ncbi:MAG: ATPase [Deltaproteobacteria bacterium]|jgi:F-type H+-transporting ATPase subunit b|nr:MAG: ATPase [Deltaproteobacteria bacterium]
MINLDITLIIQMINFLILLFVLNLILFRPIRKIIKERNQIIDDFNTDITSMTDQAQESMDQFEQKILEAKKDGMAKIQAMKEEGEEAEVQLISATNQEVQAKVEEARKRVGSEIQGARDQLQAQVQAFSVAVTEKILERSIQ